MKNERLKIGKAVVPFLNRLLFPLPSAFLVALPWMFALRLHPALACLWVFGAVVGETWLGMLGWEPKTGVYTALAGLGGALLGLWAAWLLPWLLIPLLLIECAALLDDARAGCDSPGPEPTPLSSRELYGAVAEMVCDQGYLGVSWQDVAAVHARLERGEEPTGVVEQVIVWSLWRRQQARRESE